MNVYVIGVGEFGEGSTPIAVTRSLKAARQYVHKRWGVALDPGERTNHWSAFTSPANRVDLVHVDRLRMEAP